MSAQSDQERDLEGQSELDTFISATSSHLRDHYDKWLEIGQCVLTSSHIGTWIPSSSRNSFLSSSCLASHGFEVRTEEASGKNRSRFVFNRGASQYLLFNESTWDKLLTDMLQRRQNDVDTLQKEAMALIDECLKAGETRQDIDEMEIDTIRAIRNAFSRHDDLLCLALHYFPTNPTLYILRIQNAIEERETIEEIYAKRFEAEQALWGHIGDLSADDNVLHSGDTNELSLHTSRQNDNRQAQPLAASLYSAFAARKRLLRERNQVSQTLVNHVRDMCEEGLVEVAADGANVLSGHNIRLRAQNDHATILIPNEYNGDLSTSRLDAFEQLVDLYLQFETSLLQDYEDDVEDEKLEGKRDEGTIGELEQADTSQLQDNSRDNRKSCEPSAAMLKLLSQRRRILHLLARKISMTGARKSMTTRSNKAGKEDVQTTQINNSNSSTDHISGRLTSDEVKAAMQSIEDDLEEWMGLRREIVESEHAISSQTAQAVPLLVPLLPELSTGHKIACNHITTIRKVSLRLSEGIEARLDSFPAFAFSLSNVAPGMSLASSSSSSSLTSSQPPSSSPLSTSSSSDPLYQWLRDQFTRRLTALRIDEVVIVTQLQTRQAYKSAYQKSAPDTTSEVARYHNLNTISPAPESNVRSMDRFLLSASTLLDVTLHDIADLALIMFRKWRRFALEMSILARNIIVSYYHNATMNRKMNCSSTEEADKHAYIITTASAIAREAWLLFANTVSVSASHACQPSSEQPTLALLYGKEYLAVAALMLNCDPTSSFAGQGRSCLPASFLQWAWDTAISQSSIYFGDWNRSCFGVPPTTNVVIEDFADSRSLGGFIRSLLLKYACKSLGDDSLLSLAIESCLDCDQGFHDWSHLSDLTKAMLPSLIGVLGGATSSWLHSRVNNIPDTANLHSTSNAHLCAQAMSHILQTIAKVAASDLTLNDNATNRPLSSQGSLTPLSQLAHVDQVISRILEEQRILKEVMGSGGEEMEDLDRLAGDPNLLLTPEELVSALCTYMSLEESNSSPALRSQINIIIQSALVLSTTLPDDLLDVWASCIPQHLLEIVNQEALRKARLPRLLLLPAKYHSALHAILSTSLATTALSMVPGPSHSGAMTPTYNRVARINSLPLQWLVERDDTESKTSTSPALLPQPGPSTPFNLTPTLGFIPVYLYSQELRSKCAEAISTGSLWNARFPSITSCLLRCARQRQSSERSQRKESHRGQSDVVVDGHGDDMMIHDETKTNAEEDLHSNLRLDPDDLQYVYQDSMSCLPLHHLGSAILKSAILGPIPTLSVCSPITLSAVARLLNPTPAIPLPSWAANHLAPATFDYITYSILESLIKSTNALLKEWATRCNERNQSSCKFKLRSDLLNASNEYSVPLDVLQPWTTLATSDSASCAIISSSYSPLSPLPKSVTVLAQIGQSLTSHGLCQSQPQSISTSQDLMLESVSQTLASCLVLMDREYCHLYQSILSSRNARVSYLRIFTHLVLALAFKYQHSFTNATGESTENPSTMVSLEEVLRQFDPTNPSSSDKIKAIEMAERYAASLLGSLDGSTAVELQRYISMHYSRPLLSVVRQEVSDHVASKGTTSSRNPLGIDWSTLFTTPTDTLVQHALGLFRLPTNTDIHTISSADTHVERWGGVTAGMVNAVLNHPTNGYYKAYLNILDFELSREQYAGKDRMSGLPQTLTPPPTSRPFTSTFISASLSTAPAPPSNPLAASLAQLRNIHDSTPSNRFHHSVSTLLSLITRFFEPLCVGGSPSQPPLPPFSESSAHHSNLIERVLPSLSLACRALKCDGGTDLLEVTPLYANLMPVAASITVTAEYIEQLDEQIREIDEYCDYYASAQNDEEAPTRQNLAEYADQKAELVKQREQYVSQLFMLQDTCQGIATQIDLFPLHGNFTDSSLSLCDSLVHYFNEQEACFSSLSSPRLMLLLCRTLSTMIPARTSDNENVNPPNGFPFVGIQLHFIGPLLSPDASALVGRLTSLLKTVSASSSLNDSTFAIKNALMLLHNLLNALHPSSSSSSSSLPTLSISNTSTTTTTTESAITSTKSAPSSAPLDQMSSADPSSSTAWFSSTIDAYESNVKNTFEMIIQSAATYRNASRYRQTHPTPQVDGPAKREPPVECASDDTKTETVLGKRRYDNVSKDENQDKVGHETDTIDPSTTFAKENEVDTVSKRRRVDADQCLKSSSASFDKVIEKEDQQVGSSQASAEITNSQEKKREPTRDADDTLGSENASDTTDLHGIKKRADMVDEKNVQRSDRTVFVLNLNYSVKEEDLRAMMERTTGVSVEEVRVPKHTVPIRISEASKTDSETIIDGATVNDIGEDARNAPANAKAFANRNRYRTVMVTRGRGFAYVTFATRYGAEQAIKLANGVWWNGRMLDVRWHDHKSKMEDRQLRKHSTTNTDAETLSASSSFTPSSTFSSTSQNQGTVSAQSRGDLQSRRERKNTTIPKPHVSIYVTNLPQVSLPQSVTPQDRTEIGRSAQKMIADYMMSRVRELAPNCHVRVKIPLDSATSLPKHFAFVEFEGDETLTSTILANLNKSKIRLELPLRAHGIPTDKSSSTGPLLSMNDEAQPQSLTLKGTIRAVISSSPATSSTPHPMQNPQPVSPPSSSSSSSSTSSSPSTSNTYTTVTTPSSSHNVLHRKHRGSNVPKLLQIPSKSTVENRPERKQSFALDQTNGPNSTLPLTSLQSSSPPTPLNTTTSASTAPRIIPPSLRLRHPTAGQIIPLFSVSKANVSMPQRTATDSMKVSDDNPSSPSTVTSSPTKPPTK